MHGNLEHIMAPIMHEALEGVDSREEEDNRKYKPTSPNEFLHNSQGLDWRATESLSSVNHISSHHHSLPLSRSLSLYLSHSHSLYSFPKPNTQRLHLPAHVAHGHILVSFWTGAQTSKTHYWHQMEDSLRDRQTDEQAGRQASGFKPIDEAE